MKALKLFLAIVAVLGTSVIIGCNKEKDSAPPPDKPVQQNPNTSNEKTP